MGDKNKDWVIKDIRIGNGAVTNAADPCGTFPTRHHQPVIARTLRDGPGNHSTIMGCSCGARDHEPHEYRERRHRASAWYAKHAGIEGGGALVADLLAQYDQALDVQRYPDHPLMRGITTEADPAKILKKLRREA